MKFIGSAEVAGAADIPAPARVAAGHYLCMTVNVADAVCVRPPLVPATVSGKVPMVPVTVILSEELVVPGLGLKLTTALPGCPLRLRLTAPLKPFTGVMVTV
jgi:hypothetical protein